MLTCACGVRHVCAQTTCCCSSLQSARPRRGWALSSITIERIRMLQHGASWALHRRRHKPRPIYAVSCSRWWVATLSELERCVKSVSARMGVCRCALDVCSASASRGPVRLSVQHALHPRSPLVHVTASISRLQWCSPKCVKRFALVSAGVGDACGEKPDR